MDVTRTSDLRPKKPLIFGKYPKPDEPEPKEKRDPPLGCTGDFG
jgi:hypothetical protein